MTRGTKIKLAVAFLAVAITTACSLVVDTDKDQCTTSSDCQSGATCSDGVCILGSIVDGGGDGTTTGEGGPGDATPDCAPKVPVSQSDLLNETCTSAVCTNFDNCTRLGICDDASLPALVTPPAGGI